MALSVPTLLDSVPSATDATSYATASVSPAANALLVAYIHNAKASAPDAGTPSAGFAISGSWTLIQDINLQSGNGRLQAWWAFASGSPGSGALTVDFGANTQTGAIVALLEWTGHNVTTPIPQSAEGSGGPSVTTADLSLPGALAAATSQCVGLFAANINTAITPNESETEITGSDEGHGTPNRRAQAQYEVNDTNSTWSFASAAYAAIVFEVAEAAGGNITVLPDQGTATFAAEAPTVTITAAPDQGVTTFAAEAATVAIVVAPDQGNVTFGAEAPTVIANVTLLPDQGTVTFDGLAPTVTITAAPSIADVLFGSFVATVALQAAPDQGTVTFDGLAPTVSAAGPIVVFPDQGTVTFSAETPTVAVSQVPVAQNPELFVDNRYDRWPERRWVRRRRSR
jgi:hypothetical protein